MSVTENAVKVHAQSKKTWQQLNLIMEVYNAAQNFALLNHQKAEGRVKCISEAPSYKGIPAIITGSGSSVNKFMPMAKDWKGAIFCSTTHMSTYVKYGRPPDYFVAVDPRVAPNDEFAIPPDSADNTVYVSHVSSPLEYFDRWRQRSKGLMYVYRILEPNYNWYTQFLPAIYPWVKVALLPFIDSVASQIQIAARLGYGPLFLIGCDYGGPRLDRWEYVNGEWKEDKDTSGVVLDFEKGAGGLPTHPQFMYAMRGLLISAAMQILNEERRTSIYQMSLPTNVVDLPYADLDYVMAHQDGYKEPWEEAFRAQYIHQIEVRLADSDTYLVPMKSGYGVDHRVYMMVPPNYLKAMLDINAEVLLNKFNFSKLERRFLQVTAGGTPLVIVDIATNPNALKDWGESDDGKKATEKAKAEGKAMEMRFLSIKEARGMGLIIAENGEMMVHEASEMDKWDWRKMAPLDVESEVNRLAELKRESASIPARPPFIPILPPVEVAPVSSVEPTTP